MLESTETAILQSKIKKTKDVKERIRLCAVLAHANGHPVKMIASILGISESTTYEYLTDYEKSKKTKDKPYPGRSCKLSESQEQELVEYLRQNSYNSLKQLCAYVERNYQIVYTASGLRDWLKRKNLEKKRKRRIIDPAFSR